MEEIRLRDRMRKGDKMADVNAPSCQASAMAPPVYTDDQILPRIRCQLDEQWFVLTKDTLREALQITPANNNQAFVSPPSSDALINFVNKLGYHKLVRNVSNRRHMFHPRPDSSLHLPNEEPVLGYLKFSAKGTKKEVFGMPIPGSLITADIQEASYYQEYLANVAKHRRYIAGETWSDQDSPAPKPTKPARKPKSTAPRAPPSPSVSTLATETSNKPPKVKKSKYGFTGKKRSLKSVAASNAEDLPTMEPQVAVEDADLQKALEESMKTTYAPPRGPLLPMVIREPKSGKYQPFLKVPGKGKAKVTKEQSDSEDESKKVGLEADEGGQGEVQAGPDPGAQAKGQTGSDAGAQDECQAGSNPDEISKGQARPDPGNAGADVHYIPSPVVHAGSDREHMDLDVADVSPQPSMEQLDKGFTATTYLKVQENLKLAVKEQVFDKPSKADNDKATAETEVELMVSVMIQQDMSSIPPMTSPIIDLTSRPESPKVHQQFKATTTKTTTTTTTLPPPPAQQQSTAEAMMMKHIGELEHIMTNLIQVNKDMEERLDKHGARLYTLEQLDIPQQVSKAVNEVVTDAVDWAMQAPLRNLFRDLPEANMKEILHQRMWETESYKSHEDHMQLFEALEKSMNRDHSEELAQDLAEARKKKKKSRESPKTPPGSPRHQPPPPPLQAGPSRASGAPGASGSSQVPPPPPPPSSTNQESSSKGSATPSSSKIATSAEYLAWTTTDIRLRPASALASNYSPPPEDSLLVQTGDIATFIDWFCKRRECHKLLTDSVDDPILRHNVNKPLPLGGPPGQVTIQSDFFFNKDLEYMRYGSKGSRPALSISKIKASYYLDAGLEQMVPDQFWIDEECKCDIAANYWYLTGGSKDNDSTLIDTHLKVTAVQSGHICGSSVLHESKSFLCHLNHLPPKDKKILTTAVNQWTKHLVIRQRVEDFQLGIESYQTQLNLIKPQWDATGFEYKHDYTVIDSPRAVMFQDKYEVQMIMRFNEIHKFSDGTLQKINEVLDYRVKEFRINRMNPCLNTRFWTRKDVDRSKAFMFSIQRRLKTRRIFHNLERFVGGRLREGDYRLLKRTE
nr:E-beta-farnesene synthase [Tanacetum cinerariifolium]